MSRLTLFYRLRTAKRAIEEIEQERIYFAKPEQLNDPMEGFHDLFWKGDIVVWRNLFRHYLLCFERALRLFLMDCSIPSLEDLVFSGIHNMPSPQYSNFFNDLVSDIFGRVVVCDYIERIANRTSKVRRDELCFYLDAFTACAINKILLSYNMIGDYGPPNRKTEEVSAAPCDMLPGVDFFDKLNKTGGNVENSALYVKALFTIRNQINEKIIQSKYIDQGSISAPKSSMLLDFGRLYVKAIEKLVYPDWAAICFMNECKNSSVWSHYGDRHTGVGMIFSAESDSDGEFIKLNGTISYDNSGPRYGDRKFVFHRIDYTQELVEVDFFESLSMLPIPSLLSTWYTDFCGNRSVFERSLPDKKVGKWRDNHWKNNHKIITYKTGDWAYEGEYRLILTGTFEDVKSDMARNIKYKFDSLHGIIFGINTSREDKLKIKQVIQTKCEVHCRDNFKFYQAYYSHESGSVEHIELLEFGI